MSESGISLIDFGISQDSDSTSITSTGLVSGSPAWLAPEQLEGTTLSSASDWFSAGSVLVFAAKGKSPWGNETSMTIPVLYQKILSAEPDYSGLTQEQRDLVENLLDPNPRNRTLPKALPKYSGATTTSFPISKTSTPHKVNSKRPSVSTSKSKFAISPKFTFALVALLITGGAVGFSQLYSTGSTEGASEQNEKASTGLAGRDFAPGEACGELEIAAEQLIASMSQATSDVFVSNWRTVQPAAIKAIEDYQSSISEIPDGELRNGFVEESVKHLDGLRVRFDSTDPNSSYAYITPMPEYVAWRGHVGEIFEPGNWCG
jgi:serine/threonine protein kinase